MIHRENGGLAAARNSAIERATGEYLVFVDSDDQVDRDYIKNLYQIIIRYQADLGICGYEDQYEGKELPFSTDIKMEETVCFDRLEGLKALLYQVPFDNSMWAKIYRKPLFDGLRMPQGRLYEDFAIMYRLFYRADRVVYNPYRGCLLYTSMPESCYTVEHFMEDKEPQKDTDYYYVRVRQRDQQWAGSSPIWAERV